MNTAFKDYFRCANEIPDFEAVVPLSSAAGFFQFGDAVAYGRCAGATPAAVFSDPIPDVTRNAGPCGAVLRLPFDFTEVVKNLQEERYHRESPAYLAATGLPRRLYYLLRPLLGIGFRKHLQRIHLTGWERTPFPRWPVDLSVDLLMRDTMARILKSRRLERVPFIWFWPDGAEACAMMTHDVEGRVGHRLCDELMDIDDSFGIRSAFQLIPRHRAASNGLSEKLRTRGFEVNVHDWDHDGSLFRDGATFRKRAQQINKYTKEMGCFGFRSGAMYRNQRWFDAFDFAYDMSVPNVAHLEAQPGGCCTVMPYFVGNVLELPLTTTQDYSLFHILDDYSTTLWQRQIEIIMSVHGLASFIVHPDYLVDERAQATYKELLNIIVTLAREKNVWIAPPLDVNCWWRNRSRMVIVNEGDAWRIVGPDCERATLAFAELDGDTVVFRKAGQASATGRYLFATT